MRNVAILLFDNVEVLDFAGPFEVFSVATRYGDPAPFAVYTVGVTSLVAAVGGLSVNPTYGLADCPPPDILLVPGGVGVRALLDDAALLAWLRTQADRVELLLSVCTGSLLLGQAGLLDGLPITTHHSVYDLLAEIVPTAQVVSDRRFVDNGSVITSGGISAGIDMALYVVARLLGPDHARQTADHMEYRWQPVDPA
jgi:transcriptional regulator GlxA family with amidase domain